MTKPAPIPTAGCRILASAALLIVAIAIAWHRSFSGPFILDDTPAITENPTLRPLWPPGHVLFPPSNGSTVTGRPVLNLSFALNWAFSRDAVWSYHATNVALHVLAALTLFGIVRRSLLLPALRRQFGPAALPLSTAIALLWAVHPLVTESVTYIAQRAESLAGLFTLLTLYGFIRSIDPASRSPGVWKGLSVAACLLGMGAKETAVSAPLIVILYDRALAAGSIRAALNARGRYYACLAATWVLLACLVFQTGTRGNTAGFGLGVSSFAYALTQCHAIVHYLRLAFWPSPLVIDYGIGLEPSVAKTVFPALVVAMLLAASFFALWKNEPSGVVGTAFFALLAPSSSFIPVVTQTIAEHRMYLPLACLVVAVICGAYRIFGWGSLAVSFALAMVLAGATFRRNANYASDLAIWRDTVAKRPQNARAWTELGTALYRHGQILPAIEAFESALRLKADNPALHDNFADALLDAGHPEEALREYRLAGREWPDSAEPRYGMGNTFVRLGRMAEAAACYEEALRRNPRHYGAHNNLGNVLETLGQWPNAVRQFELAVDLAPDMRQARFNLANALARLGRTDEAIDLYRELIRRAPSDADAHFNLGIVLIRSNRAAEGLPELQTALRLDPSNAKVRAALAAARAVSEAH